jgi:hypothetical protein
MKHPPHRVWVNGERYNVEYLFDVAAGEVVQRLVLPGRGGRTGGIGRYCGRVFVAVYVAPGGDELVLQVGGCRFPLDGLTKATHSRRWRGAFSELLITRPGEADLLVHQRTLARALLWRVDPAYDDLDESMDDFLMNIADIVNSESRQRWFLEISDPDAGPCEAVS